VARTSPGLQHFNTLVPSPYEDRLIIVAQGIEGHDREQEEAWRFPNFLPRRIPDIEFSSDGRSARYISHMQGVRFTIRIITLKNEFKQHLETPNVHVVYDGHARYGRGPCFGENSGPGEDWENGVNPQTGGLWRMGYPFIAIGLEDVHHHGYTANVVRAGEDLPIEDCHPDLRAAYSRVRDYTIEELDPSGELRNHVRGGVGPDDRFKAIRGSLGGDRGPHLVMRAGWTNTVSAPMDLGATNMRCRVFCHFGCSTQRHNYRILREFKNWQQTDDDHYAYWTTAPSDLKVARFWVYHVLTYPTFNAFQPWRDSLDYALRRTNRDLRNVSETYQII
jgi:hypothetical protein